MKRSKALRRLTAGLSGSIHTRGFVLWVAALVTGILCVSQHVYSTKLAEDIEGLRSTRETLETEIGLLTIEQARLTSRERIEDYATQHLDMRYPKADEVVRIGPGTTGSRARHDDNLVGGGAVVFVGG